MNDSDKMILWALAGMMFFYFRFDCPILLCMCGGMCFGTSVAIFICKRLEHKMKMMEIKYKSENNKDNYL